MAKLFISDLHLDENRPEITSAFIEFMGTRATETDTLYVLGDLFEVWLGDDDNSAFNQLIIATFQRYKGQLYFMHGNRDFLLGEAFCQATGGELLTDPTLIDCYGRNALLMHGDSLCTDDIEYMAVRKSIQTETFKAGLLAMPLGERAAFARNARAQSKQHTRQVATDIMDVNQAEVLAVMEKFKVDLLIHGHTHRPRVHHFVNPAAAGNQLTRIVLGDWNTHGWVLVTSPEGHSLQSFPVT